MRERRRVFIYIKNFELVIKSQFLGHVWSKIRSSSSVGELFVVEPVSSVLVVSFPVSKIVAVVATVV